ncbi:MAG: hypothetical protein R2706_04100 [Acidimicrobiales bacterium]
METLALARERIVGGAGWRRVTTKRAEQVIDTGWPVGVIWFVINGRERCRSPRGSDRNDWHRSRRWLEEVENTRCFGCVDGPIVGSINFVVLVGHCSP